MPLAKFVSLLFLLSQLPLAADAGRVRDVQHEGVLGDGQTDVTYSLKSVFDTAQDGDTIFFAPGTYVAAQGTSYVITKKVRISADGAELRNVRLLFLADADVSGLTMTEADCIYHQDDPAPCPEAGALITIGYIGYPIEHATVRNITINMTRAYTGIDFGYGPVRNVTIDGFQINDHEASGISVYGGSHIRIGNGSINGGPEDIVDDGIAISPYYGPIDDVAVTNVTTNQAADLVGVGFNLHWPMSNISVTNSVCKETMLCLYLKLGDGTPPPAPYTQYSYLDGFTADGIRIEDAQGARYRSSVLIAARGGSAGRNVRIANITANTRNREPLGLGIEFFLDGASQLQNVTLENVQLNDVHGGAANAPDRPGYPLFEGVYVQTDAASTLSGLTLRNASVNGTAKWGIDSANGTVSNFEIVNPDFRNIFRSANGAAPGMVYIPYAYNLSGAF